MPAQFNPEARGLEVGPTQLQLQQAMQQQAAKGAALAPTAQAQAIAGLRSGMTAQQSQVETTLQSHKAKLFALSGHQLPGMQGVLAMGANSPEGIAAAIGMV